MRIVRRTPPIGVPVRRNIIARDAKGLDRIISPFGIEYKVKLGGLFSGMKTGFNIPGRRR